VYADIDTSVPIILYGIHSMDMGQYSSYKLGVYRDASVFTTFAMFDMLAFEEKVMPGDQA
jgi:hypothetical protein